jgi:hypothetical protein
MSLPFVLDYLPGQAHLLVKQAGVGKALGTVGKGLIGFGAGTAAGIGLAEVGNRVYQASTGKQIPAHLLLPAAGLLGAGMGLAYSMYKSKELEELQDALKTRRNNASGGDSRK